jgi:hypothetical protein
MEAFMPKKKPASSIEPLIRSVRGQQVILDLDIAALYEVPTRAVLQAIKRNAERFPVDFVFRLGNEEVSNLKSQSVISSWGGRRSLPLAFTAEGLAMLSGVLHSPRAVAVNISIMREFVRLRGVANVREVVIQKLDDLQNRVDGHDLDLQKAFSVLEHMLAVTMKPKPKIGFGREEEKALRTKTGKL